MNLIKKQSLRNPWFPINLDEFFRDERIATLPSFSTTIPAVNVKDMEKIFKLEIAAPGLKKEHFSVEVENDILSIQSSFDQAGEQKENQFTRREFSYHSFRRSFSLPESVDVQKIKAQYEDGILTLTLPKRKEALSQPIKQIAIE